VSLSILYRSEKMHEHQKIDCSTRIYKEGDSKDARRTSKSPYKGEYKTSVRDEKYKASAQTHRLGGGVRLISQTQEKTPSVCVDLCVLANRIPRKRLLVACSCCTKEEKRKTSSGLGTRLYSQMFRQLSDLLTRTAALLAPPTVLTVIVR